MEEGEGFEDGWPEEVAVVDTGDGTEVAAEAGSSGELIEVGEVLEGAAEALKGIVGVERALGAGGVGGEDGVAVGVVGSAVLGGLQENGIDEITGGLEIRKVAVDGGFEGSEGVYRESPFSWRVMRRTVLSKS